MKRLSFLALLLAFAAGAMSVADPLPRDRQQEIIDNYLFVTGRSNQIPSHALAGEDPNHPWPHTVKCGMSAVADFVLNRDRIDKELIFAAGIQTDARPALSRDYGSPSGRFLVHYDVTGTHAVYQPTVVDGDGVPLYVKSVAVILDSVYTFIIDSLGFPPPPTDGFYLSGGDDRFDVYLLNLSSGFYGLSYLDSLYLGPDQIWATSYMELDATYDGLPQYANRPLDAVRVTAAHEYFHSVQFGIDWTEAEIYNENFVARYWMEMSAVWMEEQAYSAINDYYNYLPYFFDDPRNSIQQFRSYSDPRPYAAGIWPMHLSSVYGADIVREIWLRCGDYGPGPDFLTAAQVVIDSMSNHTASWATEYRNFTLKNWFTGSRAANAPDAHSWPLEERTVFPAYPDAMIKIWKDYPILQLGNSNPLNPLHNGATYIKFSDLYLVTYDTGYYNCDVYYDSACVDSTEVIDTTLGFDFFHVDSTFHDTTYWDCGIYADSVCGDSLRVSKADPWDFIHVRKRTIGYDTTYWQCTGLVDYRCVDSSAVEDTTAGYDFAYIDSLLDLSMGLGLSPLVPQMVEPWGVSIIFQLESNLDSFEVVRGTLPDAFVSLLKFPNPYQYRSITMALSPATWSNSLDYFEDELIKPDVKMDVGYQVEVEIDASDYYNLHSAVLAPYPNPAVVSRMGGAPVTFRFQVETDSVGVAIYDPSTTGDSPYLVIDIYTVAGERVRTVNGTANDGSLIDIGRGTYELKWDMRNTGGKQVAAGAYIVYARLYNNAFKELLLAEDHSKVAVIR